MPSPLTPLEQLLPFPTAEELLAKTSRAVVWVAPDTSVLDALQRMADAHIGFLPVIDDVRLAGVLSERDFALRVLLRRLPPDTTAVREIMTRDVHWVPVEARIPDCVRLMHEQGVRHLPVLRGADLAGVISVRDVMGALIERHERLLRRFREEQITLLYPDPSSY